MDIKSIIQANKEKNDPGLSFMMALSAMESKIDTLAQKIEFFADKLQSEVQKEARKYSQETNLIEILKQFDIKGLDGLPGEKGEMPVAGVDFPLPKDGKDYVLTDIDKAEIAAKIEIPIVEKIIEKTEVVKEQPIVTNEIKEVAKYETSDQIADKLNTLDEKVEMKVIKGLAKIIQTLQINIKNATKPSGGGGMGNWITEAPTGAINSLNTSYTITNRVGGAGKAIILLYNGQTQEYGNHFTVNGKTITMLFAPETGTSLFAMYVRA